MKKHILIFIVFFVAVSVFSQASIRELTGKVEVRNFGGSWSAATVGMVVSQNSEISTSFRSMAVLAVGNSLVTVKPLTRLSLEELSRTDSAETVNLYLPAGRIQASVAAPEGGSTNFSVKSPQATASVLGTDFSFDGVNTSVVQGRVAVQDTSGRIVEVSPGEQIAATAEQMNSGSASVLVQNTFTLPAAGSLPEAVPTTGLPVTRNQFVDINIEITFPE